MAHVHALKVSQPIGEFYVTVLPASVVVGRVRNRPRSSLGGDSDDVQRIFSKKRVNEIASYTEDPDATFPTPIILAVTSDRIQEVIVPHQQVAEGVQAGAPQVPEVTNPAVTLLVPDDGDMIGDVLDGQHRVLGLLHSKYKAEGDFDLVVVLMFDLDTDDKAYVFSIINSKQTPVSSSLIYDLFDLAEHRSPQKTCHFVAQAMNREPDGPFFERLKMLGKKEAHHASRVMLSQGTFAARLVELITKDSARDAVLEKRRQSLPPEDENACPLRKYYLRKEDETILKVMQNFFAAARGAFPQEWESDTGEYVIRKTVGYTALIKVLRRTLPEAFEAKDLSLGFFQQRFAQYKANLGNRPLTSAQFPSSGAGADALAAALLGS